MGLFDMYGGAADAFGYTPTASVGMVLEYFGQGPFTPERTKRKSAVGVEYKMLVKPWEDRFTGSQVLLSVMWPGWLMAF